jgi:hypothetical protein
MEIEDETLGFLNQIPRQMINHLKARGGALDFADTKTLLAERDAEWDVSEKTPKYFNGVEQAIMSLTQAGINSDLNEQRDMARYYFKSSGEFNAAVWEWENKPTVNKTWTNIKTFISTEYACKNKQKKLTTKQFRANVMEEQAEAMEELIATLTKNYTQQIEMLIKNTTEAMKGTMQLIKKKCQNFQSSQMIPEKQRKRNAMRNIGNMTRHQYVIMAIKNIH